MAPLFERSPFNDILKNDTTVEACERSIVQCIAQKLFDQLLLEKMFHSSEFIRYIPPQGLINSSGGPEADNFWVPIVLKSVHANRIFLKICRKFRELLQATKNYKKIE